MSKSFVNALNKVKFDHNQKTSSESLGVSDERINELEVKAKARLKQLFDDTDDDDSVAPSQIIEVSIKDCETPEELICCVIGAERSLERFRQAHNNPLFKLLSAIDDELSDLVL